MYTASALLHHGGLWLWLGLGGCLVLLVPFQQGGLQHRHKLLYADAVIVVLIKLLEECLKLLRVEGNYDLLLEDVAHLNTIQVSIAIPINLVEDDGHALALLLHVTDQVAHHVTIHTIEGVALIEHFLGFVVLT